MSLMGVPSPHQVTGIRPLPSGTVHWKPGTMLGIIDIQSITLLSFSKESQVLELCHQVAYPTRLKGPYTSTEGPIIRLKI
jgi:hypothetical protein